MVSVNGRGADGALWDREETIGRLFGYSRAQIDANIEARRLREAGNRTLAEARLEAAQARLAAAQSDAGRTGGLPREL